LDWYSAGFSLLIVSFVEIYVVIHVYGYTRFADDFYCMVGFHPNIYWKVTWIFITPVVLLGIIGFNAWQHVPCYLEDYVLPDWAQGLGWGMVGFALFWLPFWALVEAYKRTKFQGLCSCPYTGWTLRRLLAATPEWQPALPEHQQKRLDQNSKNIQMDGVDELDSPPSYNGNNYHSPAPASNGAPMQGYDNPTLVLDSKPDQTAL
jgi:hypothetical protein